MNIRPSIGVRPKDPASGTDSESSSLIDSSPRKDETEIGNWISRPPRKEPDVVRRSSSTHRSKRIEIRTPPNTADAPEEPQMKAETPHAKGERSKSVVHHTTVSRLNALKEKKDQEPETAEARTQPKSKPPLRFVSPFKSRKENPPEKTWLAQFKGDARTLKHAKKFLASPLYRASGEATTPGDFTTKVLLSYAAQILAEKPAAPGAKTAWQHAMEDGITLDQVVVLRLYQHQAYDDLNPFLRGLKRSEPLDDGIATAATDALDLLLENCPDELPWDKNGTFTVHRGAAWMPADADHVGATLTDAAYVSTAQSKEVVEKSFDAQYRLEIELQKGMLAKPISKYLSPKHKDESEVLVGRNVTFRIDTIATDNEIVTNSFDEKKEMSITRAKLSLAK